MVKTLKDLREARRRVAARDEPVAGSAAIEALPMLLVSDMHIGEYVKDYTRIEYVKSIAELDRDFCDFLEYHAEHRQDGKPWRLVINGDFLDFLAVTFMPSKGERSENPDFDYTVDEERFGLDNTAAKCVWKLDHIAKRHKDLFTYLADFVARGNHLDMLYGNHDVEFYWPSVQERFIEVLIRTYFGGEQVKGVTVGDFHARVRFHEWFLHVPGRIHIEHGNQYDEFSSFDHRLRPLMASDERHIAMPASHLIIRYFVNQYEGFRSHDKDNWTIVDYVRWIRGQGANNVVRLAVLYGSLFSKIWGYARIVQRAVPTLEMEEHHRTLMEEEAESYGIDSTALEQVNRLRRRPIETSFGQTMQLAAVDKYLLVLALASMVLFVLSGSVVIDVLHGFDGVGASGPWPRVLALLTISLLGAFAWGAVGRVMAAFSGGHLTTSIPPKLEEAARELAAVLKVNNVVLSHSHQPELRKLHHNPPRFYVNTGSWLARERRERHDPHCRSPLTFVTYDWDADELGLFRWCTRDKEPLVFEADVASEGEEGDERLRFVAMKHDALVDALEMAPVERPRLFRRRSGGIDVGGSWRGEGRSGRTRGGKGKGRRRR